MPSPFPGMDPYLEHPARWQDFHTSFVVELRRALSEVLDPRYFVAIEQHTDLALPGELSLVGRPDLTVAGGSGEPPTASPATAQPRLVTLPVPEEVHQRFLEVRDVGTEEVVTVVEVLSPANKQPGSDWERYERKRLDVLASRTSLVEIDLLRAGTRHPIVPDDPSGDYRLLVSRASQRPQAALWVVGVRDPLPPIPIPLRGEPEPAVALRPVIDRVYDGARYDRRIDYAAPPVPPLDGDDGGWADGLLRERGLRS